MPDSYNDALKSIITQLKATSAVTDIVGQRIYSNVPQPETFPYIVVYIRSNDYSGKDFSGQEHDVQVSCFSRDASPKETGDIRKAVFASINRNEGMALDNNTYSNVQFISGDTFKDPDGKTWHGVLNFRAVIF